MASDSASTGNRRTQKLLRGSTTPPFEVTLRYCPECQYPMEDSLRTCPWCDADVQLPDRYKPPADEDFVVGAPPAEDTPDSFFTRLKQGFALVLIVTMLCQGLGLMAISGYIFVLFMDNAQMVQASIPLFAIGLTVTGISGYLAHRWARTR